MEQVEHNLPKDVSFENVRRRDLVCPNCQGQGLTVFYSISDIPVHSCVLMSSRQEAMECPAADLELGYCSECAFITNVLFDPSKHDYSTNYEETQGFSGYFNAFLESLATRLIERYQIRNKTILEIGCGKGEFLACICRLGNNRGIGLDPAYVPERNPVNAGLNVQFLQDFYSEKYAHLKADVICCRHTLEHIPKTLDFMRTVRASVGEKERPLVFFDVPEAMRLLQEGAFWDIYYEHCTYFSTASLARLFRNAGFDIDDLCLDYSGQSINITAFPDNGKNRGFLGTNEDIEQLNIAVEKFAKTCSHSMGYWLNTISRSLADGRRIVLWGSGSKGVAFLTTLKVSEAIEYVVDINPFKHGKYMPATGQQIVPPEFLRQYNPDLVIAMNPVYMDEIQRDLDRLNVKAGLVAV